MSCLSFDLVHIILIWFISYAHTVYFAHIICHLSNTIIISLFSAQCSIPMRNEYSDRIKVKIWGDKVQTIEALGKLNSHVHVI